MARCLSVWLALLFALAANVAVAERIDPADGVAPPAIDARVLANQVTIHRDHCGVPHIFGDNDQSVIFGFGYAQAEDYFWQVEDVYILALGRYAEVHGPRGLNSDLLNRAFEIVPRSCNVPVLWSMSLSTKSKIAWCG